MLPAEAEILSLDLDAFRLLKGYRETGLAARAERAKDAKAAEAEQAASDLESVESAADDDSVTNSKTGDSPEPPSPGTGKSFGIENSDPWLDRICELEGLEDEQLCEIHGKLIAAGFLNFQMRNRITGLEYRVANAGKQYLTRKLEQASEIANDMADNAAGENFTVTDGE